MTGKNLPENFVTIEKTGHCELEIKHSRFIGVCMPVYTDEEAVEFINSVKNQHKKATHNVYAYRLTEGFRERYSDDGEPQGTAGLPVLGILKNAGVYNACIVVTRYFGGTLLGTGGLVHAYSDTAAKALEQANPHTVRLCDVMKAEVPYDISGKVLKTAEKYTSNITVEYGVAVEVTVAVDCTKTEDFIKDIREASLGKVTFAQVEKIYT